MSEHADRTSSGVIEDIEHGLAKILIGDDAGEWYFPLTALPADVSVGTCLWFVERDGRWVPLGRAQERPDATTRSIEDRLDRQRNRPRPPTP